MTDDGSTDGDGSERRPDAEPGDETNGEESTGEESTGEETARDDGDDVGRGRDAPDSPDDGDAAVGERSTYVESQVIMTTVRVVAPFAFTYGLFLSFHGGASPGGGFQGGAIVGATVLMIAFAFGIEPTREWLSNRVVAGLVAGGVVAFALIGLLPLLADGRFLEHAVYGDEFGLYHGGKYALEAVEIVGILPIVGAAVIGLFFAIAAGVPGLGPSDVGRSGGASGPRRSDQSGARRGEDS